jgi:hypothetical protein
MIGLISTMFVGQANASAVRYFDTSTLDLASAVAHCSKEVQELFTEADRFAVASVSSPRPATPLLLTAHYRLTAVKGNDPSGLWGLIIGTIKIKKVTDLRSAPQGSPGVITYQCEIERP